MTVLISDDNVLVRNWLRIMLQQLEGGQIEILEAADGDEALRLCLEKPVDLLITDIRMPGRDGITLIKELRTERPAIRTAVLSSYDDFSYVRIALKYGALDYILKAEMQLEDISALLEKTRENLSLSQGADHQIEQYGAEVQAATAAYRAYLRGTESDAAELLRLCVPESARSCLMLLNIHEPETGASAIRTAGVCCHALHIEGLPGCAFPMEGETYMMLYAPPAAKDQEERHLRLLSTLKQSLTAAKAGDLRQNVSIPLAQEDRFAERLRQAKNLIGYQVYYNSSTLPKEDSLDHAKRESAFLSNLQNLLDLHETGSACALLQEYVAERHSHRELPHRIRRTLTAASQTLLDRLAHNTRQTEDYRRLERLAQEMSDAKTAEQLQRYVDQFCATYQFCSGSGRSISSPVILYAISYCDENYARKLTLEEMAARTRLNKSYFSQLFHKEVGVSFGEYLELVRIKNAQRLLRDPQNSMSSIAERVGFANQNYFTKVFKKATGLTPSQYRTTQLQREHDQ